MQKLTDDNFLDGHHNFCLQVCHSISKSSHAYPFKNEIFKIVSFQFWQKNMHGHLHDVRLTSSNFLQIIVKALWIHSVVPVTVTIRSGQEPSDMFILAPLYNNRDKYVTPPVPTKTCRKCANAWTPKKKETYIFPKLLYIISFLQKKKKPKIDIRYLS